MIDTRYQCETPEGIALEAELAGPVIRSLAFATDFGIRIVIIFACGIIASLLGKMGGGLMLIVLFVTEWFYPVFFEVWRNGQTPGKKSAGIRVVQDNLTPVTLGSSLTRNLLRGADFLPFLYVFGFTCLLINKDFKRLGDMAAGTIVIHVPKVKVDQSQFISEIEAEQSPFPLSQEEQTAVTDYAERSKTLSEERQLELASIIAPAFEKDAKQTRGLIFSIAAWLTGASKK